MVKRYPKQSSPQKLTHKILEKAVAKAGGTKVRLAKLLGVRLGTVSLWFKGVQPCEKSLLKLEDFVSSDLNGGIDYGQGN